MRAGVAVADVHTDIASGAKASRPRLDLVLRLLRDGDTLVITRLDRLGRSLLHLVTRLRSHPETIAYQARRTAQGKSSRDIKRSLKRTLARKLYRCIQTATQPAAAS